MQCTSYREILSAEQDGEALPREIAAARAHLAGCPSCAAYETAIGDLGRRFVLRVAEPVPDLTLRITEQVRVGRDRVALGLRVALVGVAAALFVVSVQCLAETTHPGHSSHHLAMWDLAFAVGLVVVALQPHRARGLVPLGAAMVGLMIAANLIERMEGAVGDMTVTAHLLEVVATGLLWLLGRRETRSESAPSLTSTPALLAHHVPPPRLRLAAPLGALLLAGALVVVTSPQSGAATGEPTGTVDTHEHDAP